MNGQLFADAHMLAFKEAWGTIPTRITGGRILTASKLEDTEQATDLRTFHDERARSVAMRVRGFGALHHRTVIDWSVRFRTRHNQKTEIHKFLEGWCARFMMGCSKTFETAEGARYCRSAELLHWYLIDLEIVRMLGILHRPRKEWPNGDGTSGVYIPFREIEKCVIAVSPEITQLKKTFATQLPLSI